MARPQPAPAPDLIVGVNKLAWLYGKGRGWAEALLREWFEAQIPGGPVRVFKRGKRGSLYTTMPILHEHMPPGRRDYHNYPGTKKKGK